MVFQPIDIRPFSHTPVYFSPAINAQGFLSFPGSAQIFSNEAAEGFVQRDHDWHHNTETKTSRLTEFLLAVFTTKSENAVTPVGLVLVAGHRASPPVLTRLEFLAAVLWIETDHVHSLQKGWFGLLPRRISFDKRCRKEKYEHNWHMQRLHCCKRRLICPKELPLGRSLAWTADLSWWRQWLPWCCHFCPIRNIWAARNAHWRAKIAVLGGMLFVIWLYCQLWKEIA